MTLCVGVSPARVLAPSLCLLVFFTVVAMKHMLVFQSDVELRVAHSVSNCCSLKTNLCSTIKPSSYVGHRWRKLTFCTEGRPHT